MYIVGVDMRVLTALRLFASALLCFFGWHFYANGVSLGLTVSSVALALFISELFLALERINKIKTGITIKGNKILSSIIKHNPAVLKRVETDIRQCPAKLLIQLDDGEGNSYCYEVISIEYKTARSIIKESFSSNCHNIEFMEAHHKPSEHYVQKI